MSDTRLAPPIDPDSAEWWQGLEDERVILQRCDGCGRTRFPPMPGCPYCGHATASPAEAAGPGTVYSFIVVHHAFDPAFAGEVPYAVAMVELDGARIPARVEPIGEVHIGLEVEPAFHRHDGWTELRFAPAGRGGGGG